MAQYNSIMEMDIELDIHPDVIAVALTQEWKDSFYDFHSEQDVVDHLAYNLVVNGCRLSDLDGWGDRDDAEARVVRQDIG